METNRDESSRFLISFVNLCIGSRESRPAQTTIQSRRGRIVDRLRTDRLTLLSEVRLIDPKSQFDCGTQAQTEIRCVKGVGDNLEAHDPRRESCRGFPYSTNRQIWVEEKGGYRGECITVQCLLVHRATYDHQQPRSRTDSNQLGQAQPCLPYTKNGFSVLDCERYLISSPCSRSSVRSIEARIFLSRRMSCS